MARLRDRLVQFLLAGSVMFGGIFKSGDAENRSSFGSGCCNSLREGNGVTWETNYPPVPVFRVGDQYRYRYDATLELIDLDGAPASVRAVLVLDRSVTAIALRFEAVTGVADVRASEQEAVAAWTARLVTAQPAVFEAPGDEVTELRLPAAAGELLRRLSWEIRHELLWDQLPGIVAITDWPAGPQQRAEVEVVDGPLTLYRRTTTFRAGAGEPPRWEPRSTGEAYFRKRTMVSASVHRAPAARAGHHLVALRLALRNQAMWPEDDDPGRRAVRAHGVLVADPAMTATVDAAAPAVTPSPP